MEHGGNDGNSYYICRKRVYTLTVLDGAGNPQTITPAFIFMNSGDLVTLPSIDILSNLVSQIQTWNIKLTVHLKNYPSIKIEEYFQVTIEPCIVNSLTAEDRYGSTFKMFDSTKQYLNDAIATPTNRNQIPYPQSLYAFRMFYPSTWEENQLDIPTFTQVPLCNYDLKYELFHATDNTFTAYQPNMSITADFLSLDVNSGSNE